jgi:hypothetical protein
MGIRKGCQGLTATGASRKLGSGTIQGLYNIGVPGKNTEMHTSSVREARPRAKPQTVTRSEADY